MTDRDELNEVEEEKRTEEEEKQTADDSAGCR